MPRSTGRIGWYLPLLNGGEDKGLNDAGIENFHRTQHLARETVQNIIDAYDPRSKGIATAEFELTQIPRDSFPDLVQFTRFFHSCASRTAENDAGSRASQSSQFLRQGSTLLDPRRRHGIPVLRIRDRNTVGLSGDDQDRQSRWYRLVRGQGTSNIEGAGGGTYGIGQRAPFAFSSIRTILYSTMLPSGECRFMGKFILCTCLHPDHAKLTQNVGY